MSNPLNQAIISQVLHNLRNGQLRKCINMGFTEEDLKLFSQPTIISLLSNTNISWCNIKVNREIMLRLLQQISNIEQEIVTIDKMLLLNASSKMISRIFGLNHREVAFRKKILGIKKKQGRWPELDEKSEIKIWHLFADKVKLQALDIHNEHTRAHLCMVLSQETGFSMATIWQVMDKWISEKLV